MQPELRPATIKITSVKIPRLHVLDAMRGVFSVAVILGHFCLTIPLSMWPQYGWILFLTPLRFGFAFIVVFFMLSGFVLSLPYGVPTPPGAGSFLIKRLGRLYIPYAAIMGLTFLLYALTGTGPVAVNDMTLRIEGLTGPALFTPGMLGRVLLMTGVRHDLLLDPAIWTLVQEVRISLFFPLLIILCRRSWIGFTVIIACYITVALAKNSIGHYLVFSSLTDDYLTTWLTTLYIIPCFMCGIFLAKYRNRILAFMHDLPDAWRVVLWILVAINFSFIPDIQIPQPFTEAGAAILIMLVLSSKTIGEIAEARILQTLGKISYSVYLVHLPILFILKSCFHEEIGRVGLMALCFTLTFPVAMMTRRFIEVPARQLAKKLTQVIP